MSQPEGIWCLVANVAEYQEFGPEHEIRRGTKHFSPNAKVYCFPGLWGDGYENIKVIGRHRASKRFITIIMPSKRLMNWRVKVVYHPYVLSQMKESAWDEESAKYMCSTLQFWEAAKPYKRQGLDFAPPDAALVIASLYGDSQGVLRALERGADVDTAWHGWTPLTTASVWGTPEIVEILIAHKADLSIPNSHGELAVNISGGLWELEKKLLISRATPLLKLLRAWWTDWRLEEGENE